jgi:hypothetical protein
MFAASASTKPAPKVHLLGLLTTDIAGLSQLLVNNVDLRIKLIKNKAEVKKIFFVYTVKKYILKYVKNTPI